MSEAAVTHLDALLLVDGSEVTQISQPERLDKRANPRREALLSFICRPCSLGAIAGDLGRRPFHLTRHR
jgi:hypothetical protein